MAMIQCPKCGKEISDMAECCPYCGINNYKAGSNKAVNKYENIVCPHCKKTYVKLEDNENACPYCEKSSVENGPEKSMGWKNLLKNQFESKNKGILIGALVICVFLIGIIFLSKGFKNAEEQELYKRVLKAQETIVDEYGDNIEPLQVIYFYRDMEKFPPDEDYTYDYDTGYYIYFSYDMNPDGVKSEKDFIWHDGKLLFNNPIPQDRFADINTQLRKIYLLEFMMLMGEAPSTTIEEVNNQVNGSCEIDTNILKKYIGVAIDK